MVSKLRADQKHVFGVWTMKNPDGKFTGFVNHGIAGEDSSTSQDYQVGLYDTQPLAIAAAMARMVEVVQGFDFLEPELKMTITFTGKVAQSMSGVRFQAEVNGDPRPCEVSHEVLQDRFAGVGNDPIQVFESNRHEIEQVARKLILAGVSGTVFVHNSSFSD